MHSREFGLWFRSQGAKAPKGQFSCRAAKGPTYILESFSLAKILKAKEFRNNSRLRSIFILQTQYQLIFAINTIIRMLQIPTRQKNASAAPTKAVILVSKFTNRKKNSSAYTIQVGGPSRGTRFRPLSLDVPKVSSRLSHDARTAMLRHFV